MPDDSFGAPRVSTDVVVAGAGAVGLTTALALAQRGFDVALVGPSDTRANGRTVALLDGSVRLLRALGLWERIAPLGAPLAVMQIADDTGSLFRPPPVRFRAAEIGLDAFGWNVENHLLVEVLDEAARGTVGLRRIEAKVTDFDFAGDRAIAQLDDGTSLTAPLVVAADGRRSLARGSARIDMREVRYPQMAFTATLSHERPHRHISAEFHTRGGPLTLVPLPAAQSAPHRSSLVWMMRTGEAERRRRLDDAGLADEIEHRSHSMLGRIRVEGPRGIFPIVSASARQMSAPRLALVGEAAHVMPPIGAQGLNLGLRDAAHLVECLDGTRARGEDIGGTTALETYRRKRRADVASRSAGVGLLNRSLLTPLLPVDLLRGAGLVALATIGPLRRAVMREGVMPRLGGPRLMRASAVERERPSEPPHEDRSLAAPSTSA